MRNVSSEIVEKFKTHIQFSLTSFFRYRDVYEVMWKKNIL